MLQSMGSQRVEHSLVTEQQLANLEAGIKVYTGANFEGSHG